MKTMENYYGDLPVEGDSDFEEDPEKENPEKENPEKENPEKEDPEKEDPEKDPFWGYDVDEVYEAHCQLAGNQIFWRNYRRFCFDNWFKNTTMWHDVIVLLKYKRHRCMQILRER